jgi:hypothetical protein
MSVWQARGGEQKTCVIVQEVLAVFWSRTRARPGEQVKLGAIIKDVKDGTKAQFAVLYQGETLATVDSKVQGGKADGDWKIDLPEKNWPQDAILELDCTVQEKIRARPSQRGQLHLDLGLPAFSA